MTEKLVKAAERLLEWGYLSSNPMYQRDHDALRAAVALAPDTEATVERLTKELAEAREALAQQIDELFAYRARAEAREASAPDLAKALEAILGTTPDKRQNPSVWFPRVDRARAALAKAKGEAPAE
jgi:multidrug resistance efflux pump